MRNLRKRWLSLALAFVLIIGLVPGAAFADEAEDEFNYVILGDSTTNGYGFEKYFLSDGTDVRGYRQIVTEAYPSLIKEELEKTYGVGNVHMAQLAGSAMRPADLDLILNGCADCGFAPCPGQLPHVCDDYTNRLLMGHNEGRNTTGEEWLAVWAAVETALEEGKTPNAETKTDAYAGNIDTAKANAKEALTKLHGVYTQAIEEADLITYYLGGNDFGTFITAALTDGRYGDDDTLQDLLDGLSAQLSAVGASLDLPMKVEELEGQIIQTLGASLDENALGMLLKYDLIDVILHTYLNFLIHFTKNIEAIRALNPDCEIVVLGLHDYTDFLKLDLGTELFDVGAVLDAIMELANLYVSTLAINSEQYYYADLFNTEIETFIDGIIAVNEGSSASYNETILKELDKMMYGAAKAQVDPALENAGIVGWSEGEILQLIAAARHFASDGEKRFDNFAAYITSEPKMKALAQANDADIDALAETLDDYDITISDIMELSYYFALYTQYTTEPGNKEENASSIAASAQNKFLSLARPIFIKIVDNTNVNVSIPTGAFGFFGGIANMFIQQEVRAQKQQIKNDINALTTIDGFTNYIGGLLVQFGGMSQQEAGAQVTAWMTGLGQLGAVLVTVDTLGQMIYGAEVQILQCVNKAPISASVLMGGVSDKTVAAIGGKLLGDGLTDDDKALLNLYFLFAFANGIGAHPDALGHMAIRDTVLNAYNNKIRYPRNPESSPAFDPEYTVQEDSFYTSLGDSTVFGYGLTDENTGITNSVFGYNADQMTGLGYDNITSSTWGFMQCSKASYPYLIKEALGLGDDQFAQLAMGLLRAEDILFILTGEGADEYTQYIEDQFKGFENKINGDPMTLSMVHDAYYENIEKSDLITISFGGNNFATYVVQAVLGGWNVGFDKEGEGLNKYLTGPYAEYVAAAKEAVPAVAGALAGSLEAAIPDIALQAYGSAEAVLAQALYAAVYTYLGVADSSDDILDAVHKINTEAGKNAKVVLAGLYNTADKVYFNNGIALKIGNLIGLEVGSLNDIFRSYADANSEWCRYADTSDVQIFEDTDENAADYYNLAIPGPNGTYLDYMSVDFGLVCHPDAVGHAYVEEQILDVIRPVKCIIGKPVTLSQPGSYHFYKGMTDLGEFTFTKSGSGWTIQNKDGQYLARSGASLAFSNTPLVWTYSNGYFKNSDGGSVYIVGIDNNERGYGLIGANNYQRYEKLTVCEQTSHIGHDMEEYAAKKATCQDPGSSAYWICKDCGGVFADARGRRETTEVASVIPADPTAHTYGDDHICTVCDAHDPAVISVTAKQTDTGVQAEFFNKLTEGQSAYAAFYNEAGRMLGLVNLTADAKAKETVDITVPRSAAGYARCKIMIVDPAFAPLCDFAEITKQAEN